MKHRRVREYLEYEARPGVWLECVCTALRKHTPIRFARAIHEREPQSFRIVRVYERLKSKRSA